MYVVYLLSGESLVESRVANASRISGKKHKDAQHGDYNLVGSFIIPCAIL